MRTTKTIALALVVGLVALIAASAARPSGAAAVPANSSGSPPRPTRRWKTSNTCGRAGSAACAGRWSGKRSSRRRRANTTGPATTKSSKWPPAGTCACSHSSTGPPRGSPTATPSCRSTAAASAAAGPNSSKRPSNATAPTANSGPNTGPAARNRCRAFPVRDWQVWNEANFFYFATPASPQRYAKLLKMTSAAIKGVEPSARVILSGLFGDPTAQPPNGLPAVQFLEQLYRVPGIKSEFDAVALHPYADEAERPRGTGRRNPGRGPRKPRSRRRPLHHRDGVGLAERPQHRQLRARGPGAR